MKIKHILLLAALMVFAACASQGIGEDFDTYVLHNGNPITFQRLRNGNTIYTYTEPCKYYPELTQEYALTVNSKNKIVRKTNLNSCRGDNIKKKVEKAEEIPDRKFVREMFPQYNENQPF